MSKKISELTKTERVLIIKDILDGLGRAGPDHIIESLKRRVTLDIDESNLKRSVYRDLKSLEESGEIQVELFDPSGVKINPEEENQHRNIRVEYFIKEQGAMFPGSSLLEPMGLKLVPTNQNIFSWKIKKPTSELTLGSLNILISNHLGSLCLSIPKAELPIKLLFARPPESKEDLYSTESVREQYGVRSCLLLIRDTGVSAQRKNGRYGHCLFSSEKGNNTFSIQDLGSTAGTYFAPISFEDISRTLGEFKEDRTRSNGIINQGNDLIEMQKIATVISSINLPLALSIGGTAIKIFFT